MGTNKMKQDGSSKVGTISKAQKCSALDIVPTLDDPVLFQFVCAHGADGECR